MSLPFPPLPLALLVIVFSLAIQLGFALGVFGPAWLSPLLTLPALTAIAWLWRRAEKEKQTSQDFAKLVI